MKELLADGRLQQVEEVLSRARNLVAGERVHAIPLLEIRIAMARGHWSQARDRVIALWGRSEGGQSLDIEERLLIADVLVLSFETDPVPDHELEREKAAIHEALHALSEADFTAVDAALRPLGRRSLFADWKLLIKGLVAFYAQDAKRATACFERLSSDGVPGRAARAFLSLTSSNSPVADRTNPPHMGLMCHLMGQPEAAAYMPSVPNP